MSLESKLRDYQDNRHHQNPFAEYSAEAASDLINFSTDTIHENLDKTLKQKISDWLKLIEENKLWIKDDDYSMYTGLVGYAYLYYFYGKQFDDPSYIAKAAELIERCNSKKSSRRNITFLTGDAGQLAVGSVVYNSLGDQSKSEQLIQKLKSLWEYAATDSYDELLYGRVGYLYSLLFVNKHIQSKSINDELIKQVIGSIIASGKSCAATRPYKTRLMYSWHDSEYLGGAHGLAGILYILLQAREYLTDDQLKKEIEPTLKFLITLRYPSGNFPSSIGSKSDRLVHWCHGAPSMSMLFTLAHQIFADPEYSEIAKDCGDVIWARGLLKKGCGLCHGVSGNAYSFLNLFQSTNDLKYLYQACKFAEWCIDYDKRQESGQDRIPDRPFSLFEGLAGLIYYFIDLTKPEDAKFPGYTL